VLRAAKERLSDGKVPFCVIRSPLVLAKPTNTCSAAACPLWYG
jgi:hypothetical protein